MENYFYYEAMPQETEQGTGNGTEQCNAENDGWETNVMDVKKKILNIAGISGVYEEVNEPIVDLFNAKMEYLKVIELFRKRKMNRTPEDKKRYRTELERLCKDVRISWERCKAIHEAVKNKERTELKTAKLQELRKKRLNEKNEYVDELDRYFESIASKEIRFSDVKVCTCFYMLRRAMYQTLCPEFLITRMRELLIWDANEIHRLNEKYKRLERKQEHIDKFNAMMDEIKKAKKINAVDDIID